MPKVTKLKATQNVAPKRDVTEDKSDEPKPMITVVDKTQTKKRKASASPIKVKYPSRSCLLNEICLWVESEEGTFNQGR